MKGGPGASPTSFLDDLSKKFPDVAKGGAGAGAKSEL